MTQLLITLAFFYTLSIAPLQAAQKINPDHVREVFAMSKDSKLELAADAMDDDSLLQLLEELKKSPTPPNSIKKILKK